MSTQPTAGSSAIQHTTLYSVKEYLTWSGEERWELIHGVPYNMSPAPSVTHQRIVGNLFGELREYTGRVGSCEAFIAPTDLFLPTQNEQGEEDTVVQPDVMVICDKRIVSEKGITGAPTLVIEVLSDSTAYKDLSEKKLLYEQTGVSEYWVVNPTTGTVLRWTRLSGGDRSFEPVREYRRGDAVDSQELAGFTWMFPSGARAE